MSIEIEQKRINHFCFLFQAAFLELDKSPELFHFVLTELSNSTYRDSLIEELKELYSKEKVECWQTVS